jgi:secreted trypsin-like serine protease
MLALLAAGVAPAGARAGAPSATTHQHRGSSLATTLRRVPVGRDRAYAAIVGGRLARVGQFPWLARVVAHRGKTVDGCSGTVVARELVLTAAHCVEDLQTGAVRLATDFEVQTAAHVAGRVTRRSSRVSAVLVYPGFERSSGVGDAALLELSTPTSAPSIQLASEAGPWPAGTRALMTGWGRTGEAMRRQRLPFLRWADTVVQSPEWCAARLRGFYGRRQLCAMNSPRDNTAGCAGDSGGPLLVERGGETIEIGVLNGSVVSRLSVASCVTSEPTVFARSSVIAAWVHEWSQRVSSVPIAVSEGSPKS